MTFHEDKDEVFDDGGQGRTSVTPTGLEEDAATVTSEDNESVYSESSAGMSSTTGGNLMGYFGRFKESQSGEVYTSLFPSLQDFKDNIVGCFNIFEETVGESNFQSTLLDCLREPTYEKKSASLKMLIVGAS